MGTIFQILGIFILFTLTSATALTCSPPCQHGGTCFINASNVTECVCPVGFMGPACTQIDVCASSPCLNGGACVPDKTAPNNFHCVCLPGFSSSNCSTLLYPCAIDPCVNGTCMNNVTNTTFSTYCDCLPGYTGANCDTFAGLCIEDPCTSVDTQAQCHNDDSMYECECSSHDYFGLNCETPSKNCEEEDESYCVCVVNGLPVKVPIPSPAPDDGINWRDIISALLGILLGWLLGTLLLHLCCYYCVKEIQEKKPERPWSRPQSAQSNSTVTSGISSSTIPDDPITPTSPNKVAPAATALAPAPKGNHMPINVYRAAFVDELSHTVSTRKSTVTYLDGKQDW